MTIYCKPCYERSGVLVVATNRGDVWRCDPCAEDAYDRQQARDMAAYHGGASWMGSASIEHAKADGAMAMSLIALPKPAKGASRAEKLAKRAAVVAAEERAKLGARVRDGYRCRVPGCSTNLEKWRLEGAHLEAAGMGGNPNGSRGSERRHYVSVCFPHHQGARSLHSADLRAVPLDDQALGDGPVRFDELTEGGWKPLGVS